MNDFELLRAVKKAERYGCLSEYGIFERIGKCAETTDFSVLLGGRANLGNECKSTLSDETINGSWSTLSLHDFNYINIVNEYGSYSKTSLTARDCGVRPTIAYSKILANCTIREMWIRGVKEVEYLECPQTLADLTTSNQLEMLYNDEALSTTGGRYITDSVDIDDCETGFTARYHIEYAYNGGKYIRFIGDKNGEGKILSNREKVKIGNVYWLKVEPIIWLIDEVKDIAISKKVLFAGVQFQCLGEPYLYESGFFNTNLGWFMNECFFKEIYNNLEREGRGMYCTKEHNSYNLNFDSVTEEDIIRGALLSNISVFLHGKSSEGKTSRIKQLDPDCVVVYMSNESYDSFVGKSVYNSVVNEMMDKPPTWYLKIKEKCESEPNKIHIVFFDEITHALPSVQGMAYNVVLDGEINGKWKLPFNARIVAAGNDFGESMIANQIPEPLFNRFAHVYISTTVDSWLRWAITPKEEYERLDYEEFLFPSKIHPAIYAFVAYNSCIGRDVLRTQYDGKKPNADPRKWEMASRMLFRTGQPEMLRSLIGKELTNEFIQFLRCCAISIYDVIGNRYTDEYLEMDMSQKFITAVGLSFVDDENFEIVRDFMKKLGEEPRAVFEGMWAAGDEERLDKIKELRENDKFQKVKVR